MNKLHRIAALMLALLFLTLAACGKGGTVNPSGGDVAEQIDVSKPEPETGPTDWRQAESFVIENLMNENAVSKLISDYGAFAMLRYEKDKLYSETYYFEHDGKTVWTRRVDDPGSGETLSCCVEDVVYEKNGDHLQYSYALEEDPEPNEDYSIEYDVCEELLYGVVENIDGTDAHVWKFDVRDNYDPETVCHCTADKQTLMLKTIDWNYGDGSSSRIELSHGDSVKPKDFGLMDGFDKPMRTILCTSTLYDEAGKPTEKTVKFEAPYHAEPVFQYEGELSLYADKDFSEQYVYPGDGKSYTVFVTNAMG